MPSTAIRALRQAAHDFYGGLDNAHRWQLGDQLAMDRIHWPDWGCPDEEPAQEWVDALQRIRWHWELRGKMPRLYRGKAYRDRAGCVLIVEDHGASARTYNRMLTSAGHQVIFAPCGEVGLQRISEDRPDVVLCDVDLPNVGGLDVLTITRAEHPELPVILTTGHMRPELFSLGRQAHAAFYLLKPMGMASLVRCVRTCMMLRETWEAK